MNRARKNPTPTTPPVTEVDTLTVINPNAAGSDIGQAESWVSVPTDRAPQPLRRFDMNTPDLIAIADGLQACGVTTVVMESTGVYY